MAIISKKRIDRFREYLSEAEKAEATVEQYVRDVRCFAAWLGERSLNKTAILAYKRRLSETRSPAGVNTALASLNAFLAFIGRRELRVKALKIQANPFASAEKELTKEEYGRLLAAAKKKQSKRLYHVMQTICATGIRISELKFITAEAVKDGRATIDCKGKVRTVFLPRELCRTLDGYLTNCGRTAGPVFVTSSGRPLDRSNVWTAMKRLCKEARVSPKKVFPHNLRHLFARTFYAIQKDIVRLADVLGHTSINTTRIYTRESGFAHRRQLERIGTVLLRL